MAWFRCCRDDDEGVGNIPFPTSGAKVDHIWSLCCQLKPDSRPSMGEVLSDHGVVALQTQQGVGIFVLHY